MNSITTNQQVAEGQEDDDDDWREIYGPEDDDARLNEAPLLDLDDDEFDEDE